MPEKWKEVIDTHLQKSVAITANNHFPFTVASIYIEENYLDRLLVLVKQEEDLGHILYYHDVLLKDYPLDLLQIYLQAIKKAGTNVSDRKQYRDLIKQMTRIIKDIPDGKEQILTIAKEWMTTYYRRPAMVEELRVFVSDHLLSRNEQN